MILQFLGNGIINGSLIALAALGFALVYNTTRIFHIAYAGIYVIAGYLLYFFIENLHWPLLPALIMVMAGAAGLSLLCDMIVYKPLTKRDRSSDTLMISSVGILIVFVSGTELLFGNAARYINLQGAGNIMTLQTSISAFRLIAFGLAMIFIIVFFAYLKFSSSGIRIRALRDSELLSRVFGVRADRVRALLFMLSGVSVALAASLSALDVGINPHLGIPVFINAFVALVIGGIGRFDGPVIGGLLLGILQAMTEYFFDSRWVMMVTFIMLIVFLVIRPQGLIAEKARSF